MNSLLTKSAYIQKLYNIFLYFLIYSFTGWLIETVYMSFYNGQLTKRGFLLGPLCGIYGIGAITVISLFAKIKSRPVIIFILSSVLLTELELITGILLKVLFNRQSWDYSERFANFMGFICLRNSIIWGVLSLLLIYFIHPRVSKFINSLTVKTKAIIFYNIFIFLTADITISIYTSLNGIDNITWVSQTLQEKFNNLESMTSKVVYYISR